MAFSFKARWRLIKGGMYDAYTNMAIDEALAILAEKNNTPTIRLSYCWKKPGGVSLGINQQISDINLNYCLAKKIPIVRRPTGGMALYHTHQDFTYCVLLPIQEKKYRIQESYSMICQWISNGLSALGIPVNLEHTSLSVQGKKISGNAQTRTLGSLLQHGSVFYSLSLKHLTQIFQTPPKIFQEKTTCIKDFKSISVKDMHDAFERSFLEGKDFFEQDLEQEELDIVEKLLQTKYRTAEWNFNAGKKSKGSCHINALP